MQRLSRLSLADLADHIHPCAQVEVSQSQFAFHAFQVRRNLRRDRLFCRLEREFILRQQPGSPVAHLLRRADSPLQVGERETLIAVADVRPQPQRQRGLRQRIARIRGCLDRLFNGRLDMFAECQRLIVGDARQVARARVAGRGLGLEQLLREDDIHATGTHERERVPHSGIRLPGWQPLKQKRIHLIVDLLPDILKLARRAQVALDSGIVHRAILRVRAQPLEPLTHNSVQYPFQKV